MQCVSEAIGCWTLLWGADDEEQKSRHTHTNWTDFTAAHTLLEEKVLYRTLKGSKALRIWNP